MADHAAWDRKGSPLLPGAGGGEFVWWIAAPRLDAGCNEASVYGEEKRADPHIVTSTSFGVSSFPKIVNRVSCTIYEFTYLERKTLKVELEYGKTNQKKDAFFCEIVYSITVYTL